MWRPQISVAIDFVLAHCGILVPSEVHLEVLVTLNFDHTVPVVLMRFLSYMFQAPVDVCTSLLPQQFSALRIMTAVRAPRKPT